MIEEKQVEAALNYLSKTDEQSAAAKGRVKALEYRLKVEKAIQFLQASGTVAEKEATSLASETYADMVNEYQEAVTEFETFAAKRERAVLTIDVWRTEAANRRNG